MRTRGTPPKQFGQERQEALVTVLNTVTTGLYGDVVKASPVGVGGRLQRSWTLTPASLSDPVASIGTNSNYFLPLELGRKPGKGISREGQNSVALWAKRKLRKSDKESQSFAYLLSRKYKREGRPSTMLLGLASSGSMGASIPKSALGAVKGSLLETAVKKLQTELKKV